MKKLLSMLFLMAVLSLSNSTTHAQPANFLWVEQARGTGSDFGRAIATDGSGNSIVTGSFDGTATFGDTTLTSAAFSDIFIAKYDGDGNFLWVVQAGGTASNAGAAIATDGSGNSIVTGRFNGTVTFGDTTLTSSAGSLDIFIAKYDGEGNFLWVEQAGVTGMHFRLDAFHGNDPAIATDGSGNSIVTGSFFGTATFGDTTLTTAGSRDIFIAKYVGDGNFLWVEQAGGGASDEGFAIATDGSGNSIVTGHFSGTATFGDTTLTSAGSRDIFIAKYDGDGNFLWVEQAGGTDGPFGGAIATDGSGNSIVTGWFRGTATFGDTTLTSAGSGDIFIAKYDGEGNFLWVEQAGGTDSDLGLAIATDGSGNSIVTGDFSGTATFGDITLSSAGSEDIFIAEYDGDGNFLRVRQAGGTNTETGAAIATDASGNSIVTGEFRGTATFGDTTLTTAGSSDIFIAKLGPLPGSVIVLNPTSVSFGGVEVGSTSDTVTITITNFGLDTLVVTNISPPGTHFSLISAPSIPLLIPTFDRALVAVAFIPQVEGDLSDSIIVSSNDSSNPTLAVALSGRGVVIGQAQAGILYAASIGPTSQLFTIDLTTGAPTPIGPTGVPEIRGMAIQPSTKEIYGTLPGALGTTLLRVSSEQGDAVLTTTIPLNNVWGIAFNENDTLFAATIGGKLYRVDVSSGDTTFVGAATGVLYSGLSFSPTSGELWASVRFQDKIYIVDQSNGSTTLVGSTGFSGGTNSIAFDGLGRLYGVTGLQDVIMIDTTTAAGTLIGPTGLKDSSIFALAMRTDVIISVAEGDVPLVFSLGQNYPNPFNPSTTIEFSLPHTGFVTLKVYNILGEAVATLVNEELNVGTYTTQWNASGVASGVYFYRLQAGDFVDTKKLLLLK